MKFVGHHLLPLLLALTLARLTVAAPTVASEEKTSLSPRASLLSHWRQLFPMNPEIPAFLLSRSSPLTAAQIATFLSYIDTHTLNTPAHLSDFCSAANVLCSNNLPRGDLDIPCNIYTTFMGPQSLPAASLEPGLFFREANITAGQKLHIADIQDKIPKTSFLPKYLSDKLPFSSKSMQNIIDLLGVSRMQQAMSRTISTCEVPPQDGEHKSCVLSIEGMADFAAATVGQKAEVLATVSADGSGQDATVVNAMGRNGGQVSPTLGCHRVMFPYLVYYCHSFSNVKLYEVELLIANGAVEKKNRVVAMCHMDTSKWNAEHISFKMLGSGPGKTEVCHLMNDGEFAWVARESPLMEAAGLPNESVSA